MDLLLGNLTTLKQHLLPNALSASAVNDPALALAQQRLVKDDVLVSLGLGLALSFERECNRRFARLVDASVEFSGDRLSYVLPRYPIEAITRLQFRGNAASPWTDLNLSEIQAIDESSGLIEFGALAGNHLSRVRVTWTGGYWVETKEPTDSGYPQTMPVGASALPSDLQLAWLLYCQEVWNKRDKLGLNLNAAPDARVAIAKLQLPTGIVDMIRPYVRMQLS